jgi:hypothetical protein
MTSLDPIFNPPTFLLVAEVGDFEAGQQAAIHRLFLPIFIPCTVESFFPDPLPSIYCQWWLRGPVSPSSTGLGLATALAVSVIGTQVKPRPKPRTSVQPHCLLICFTAIWALASNTTSLNVEMWRAVSTAAQDGRTRRVQIYAPPP